MLLQSFELWSRVLAVGAAFSCAAYCGFLNVSINNSLVLQMVD